VTNYNPRLIDEYLADVFAELPAIMITGPRACGKTTTARHLVPNLVDLSLPGVAQLFNEDPDGALARTEEPVTLDEWQEAPPVLGAIKRAVDLSFTPSRYLLTGSVTGQVTTHSWPGTGRVVEVPLLPMTQRELRGKLHSPLFVDRVLADDVTSSLATTETLSSAPSLTHYLDLALTGGFPQAAFATSNRQRALWLRGYVDLLIGRDVAATGVAPDSGRFRSYVAAIGLNTAGVIDASSLADGIQVAPATVRRYDALLEALYLLDLVPAWYSNRMTRLAKRPKRYLIDPSLMAPAADLDTETILRDGGLYGRLLDTFVAAQIRPELALSANHPRLYHLRDQDGRHEVDLVLEYSLGRVVGIEVKSASSVGRPDARHLEWMRDQLGDKFVAGVVLHSGPMAFMLSDRIAAAPISTLWA